MAVLCLYIICSYYKQNFLRNLVLNNAVIVYRIKSVPIGGIGTNFLLFNPLRTKTKKNSFEKNIHNTSLNLWNLYHKGTFF